MKVRYNAPVVLTLTLISAIVLAVNQYKMPGLIPAWFSLGANFNPQSYRNWITLITHVLGSANWNQLLTNFAFILLLGPILEESYSSWQLVAMIMLTALVTAMINILVFKADMLGASGIVFMMILLASFANFSKGELPLSFVLVLIIYLGREIMASFETGSTYEFAHIIGGFCGSLFGFFKPGHSRKRPK
jgi:membrane associated rhomboid family serine protease